MYIPPFLFIGRLSEEKGIGYLLDTFKDNGWELQIGGDGPLICTVTDVCNRFPNIRYLGNLTKEQVRQQMQNCTVLIFPSTWYEGMPMTIIEAFSQGLPVIAGNLGAMPAMIKDGYNGLLFKAGDLFDLQAKLTKWQSKLREEKEQFSKNAYQTYLNNYTPEKNLSQLLAIYNSVINHK